MANYTLPTTTRISRINRTLNSSTFLQASPFSGGVQSQDWGGSWWEYEIDFDITQDAEGKALSAFLTRLRGPANTFTFRDPSINNKYQPGTIRVKGASQTGDTLVTDGWVPQEGNLLRWCFDFSKSEWVGNSQFTPTASSTIFSGESGYLMTNPGATSEKVIFQEITSVDPTAKKYASLIVEDGDEVTATDVVSAGIWNRTKNSWAVLGTYTFSTDSFAVVQSNNDGAFNAAISSLTRAESPVNGGTRVKQLFMNVESTDIDDTFAFYIYPTGLLTNTNSSHLYFAAYGENASTYNGSTSIERTVLEAGDFISIGSGADARLYQVVEDCVADSNLADSTLTIVPSLRSSPADNAVVEVLDPIVSLRTLQPVPNAVTTPINYRFTMQARENI